MTKARIELPRKLIPLFSGEARYRCAWGGRGSAKTRSFAKMTAVKAYQWAEAGKRGVILCAREYMNSLDESSMEEVKGAIASEPWLADYFDVGEKYIRTKNGRVRYVFAGLRHNLDSIKSKAKILLCWVDEAESVSEMAYRKLLPTIREEGSECWITWNPESSDSPTNKRFRDNPPDRWKGVELNYTDNPWFPAVLEQERLNDLKRDPDMYAHVWEGEYITRSDAQILAGKWRAADFEPGEDWDGPYLGADFGFAQDPTTLVKCWVHANTLYIEREAGKVGLELDHTAAYFQTQVPGCEQYTVRADSARPESISYLKRHGLPRMVGVKKWPGSVEDGIAHLRSYDEIVVHTRCTGVQSECRKYSYKIDRQSGDVLPQVVDAFNHYIDAVRYGLAPLIKRDKPIGITMRTAH